VPDSDEAPHERPVAGPGRARRRLRRARALRETAPAAGLRVREASDRREHAAEDVGVERVEQVPVREAEEAPWVEDRRLADLGAAGPERCDLELQPGAAGTFISADSRSRRWGWQASTRQKSRASPAAGPRIGAPAPHADSADEQVESAAQPPEGVRGVPALLAPMRRIGANAASGSAATTTDRLSTMRLPRRRPPQPGAGRPVEESASYQRVARSSASSSDLARATASRNGRGRSSGKSRPAASERTTVALRTLSTSVRPTRAYSGVTSPSHRLDSRGVSSGTGPAASAGRAAPRTRA